MPSLALTKQAKVVVRNRSSDRRAATDRAEESVSEVIKIDGRQAAAILFVLLSTSVLYFQAYMTLLGILADLLSHALLTEPTCPDAKHLTLYGGAVASLLQLSFVIPGRLERAIC
jgi:hypothetical protein